MKKKTQILLTLLWGLAVAGSRAAYFFFDGQTVVDTYEYFANAVIRAEKGMIVFQSGLAHAYSGNLAKILRIFGEKPDIAGYCQMIQQIFWILLLAAGIGLIFGKLTGFFAGTFFAAVPFFLKDMKVIAPENFFLLHFALALLLLGIFYVQTRDRGWYRNDFCEIYLLLTGFYLGILCIWNYIGYGLVMISIYILAQNRYALRMKIFNQRYNGGKEGKEPLKGQLLGIGSQAVILLLGICVGMYATLMKYTGVTGLNIVEQFADWAVSLKEFPGRCQDISFRLAVVLFGAVLGGILFQMLVSFVQRTKTVEEKKTDKKAEKVVRKREMAKKNPVEKENESQYVMTEDGRKIKLLDNPLPMPPRHVKKEIEFDMDEIQMAEQPLDFDVDITDNDDFDI